MRFSFTGNLGFNSLDSKLPWMREDKTKSGDDYRTLNIAVSSQKNNRAMTEIFSMKSKEILTRDNENNNITIPWESRFDSDVIEQVANYKKHTIKDGDERNVFVAPWDFTNYIKENVDNFKEGVWRVDGQIQKNVYNGTVSDRFVIQNIYKMDDEAKRQLKISGEFFFSKESIDTADWGSEKKLYINGWTRDYVSKEVGIKYVSQQIVFDAKKIQFDNEKHVNLLKYKLKQIGLTLDGEKIKNGLKAGKYYKMGVVLSYFNGAETVDFTPDMLTENQKIAIELGLKKLEDFQPSGSIFGDRIVEYRLIDYNLRDEYSDGCIEIDETVAEFEEEIYHVEAEESVEDLLNDENKNDDDSDDDLSDEDLFS